MHTLKKFIKQFKGSSFPTEVVLTTREKCVLKMKGAGNHTQSLAQEFIVNHMTSSLGWPVPKVFPVIIPQNFPWEFGTDEFDDIIQKSYGMNLGIELIEDAECIQPDEMLKLDADILRKIAALDAFFCNYDRIATSGNILRDPKGKIWFIDHGSCMFLDPMISKKPLELAPNHALKAQESKLLDMKLVRKLCDESKFHSAVEDLPTSWQDHMDLNPSEVFDKLKSRITF